MLRTKDFRVYYEKAKLIQPTDFEFEAQRVIKALFAGMFDPKTIYRSSGVIFEDLTEQAQLSLFSSAHDNRRAEDLTSAWDRLEDRYGRGAVFTAI